MANAKEIKSGIVVYVYIARITNNKHKNHKLPDDTDYQSHHPITNNDVHLCLFNRFHENNASSEIESFGNNGCVPLGILVVYLS